MNHDFQNTPLFLSLLVHPPTLCLLCRVKIRSTVEILLCSLEGLWSLAGFPRALPHPLAFLCITLFCKFRGWISVTFTLLSMLLEESLFKWPSSDSSAAVMGSRASLQTAGIEFVSPVAAFLLGLPLGLPIDLL